MRGLTDIHRHRCSSKNCFATIYFSVLSSTTYLLKSYFSSTGCTLGKFSSVIVAQQTKLNQEKKYRQPKYIFFPSYQQAVLWSYLASSLLQRKPSTMR